MRSRKIAVSPPGLEGAGRRGNGLSHALVAGVALLAYANTLGNGFVFDDDQLILNNVWLTDVGHLPAIFSSDYWGFHNGRLSNFYRPFAHVVYLACVRCFGVAAWPFHLVNVVLHAGSSLLVFVLASRLAAAATAVPALAAGLLFAVHPIHTEPVAWIAGLPDLAFSFLALGLLAWHARSGEPTRWSAARSGGAFLLALLFKETAVVVLPLLVAHDLLWRRPAGARSWAKRYAPFAAALAVTFVLRANALGGAGTMHPVPPYGTLSPEAYLANVLRFHALYLGKLLVPIHLNPVPDLLPIDSLLAGSALLGGLLALAGAAGVALAWRRHREACFALLVLLLPLAPVLLVPAYSNVPFGERYLYLPSAGLSLAAALLAARLSSSSRTVRVASAAAFGCVLAGFLAATVLRNRVWRDDLTLFADVVSRSPRNEMANGSLGRALIAAGRHEEAAAFLRTALEVNPSSVKARYHLGRALLKGGRTAEATAELEAVRKVSPGIEVLRDLADAYGDAGRFGDAIRIRREIVDLLPGSAPERNLLGIDCASAERYEEAAAAFEAAARLDPSEPAYRKNLERARGLSGRSPVRG